MKFEVTHPKIWKKLAETNMPMKNKIKVYEKMGGAYRLGKDGGEQVFNKLFIHYQNTLLPIGPVGSLVSLEARQQ